MLLGAERPADEIWTGGSSLGGGLTHRIARSGIVEIAPTDIGFLSWGCGVWVPGLSPILAPGQPFGEGTFLVGAEIEPGRYRAAGGVPGRLCVWWRLSGFGGNGPSPAGAPPASSRFVAGMGEGAGTAVADIASTDAGFSSLGCGVWSRSRMPAATPGQPFGDGSFLVGDEVAPGRYRNPGVSGYLECTWRRLSGFGGEPGDILGKAGPGPEPRSEWWTTFRRASSTSSRRMRGSTVTAAGWTSDFAPLATPGEPLGAGAYLVGPEVTPGRYRSDSLGYCLWERLSGFGGRPGDVVQSVGIKGADALAPRRRDLAGRRRLPELGLRRVDARPLASLPPPATANAGSAAARRLEVCARAGGRAVVSRAARRRLTPA